MLSDGRVEDEKLPEETSRERHPGKRHHPDQHREGEKGRPFRETCVIVNLFSGVVSDDDEHGKTKQRHQQIRDEIKADRRSREKRRRRSADNPHGRCLNRRAAV